MSTTLHFLSLPGELEALYRDSQRAEKAYWTLITTNAISSIPQDELIAAQEAFERTSDAWYEARVAMAGDQQLPILESSHRDIHRCELLGLFDLQEDGIVTVSDSNIEEIADAWEDSDQKRTFSLGRGKGTVYSWLLAHRGEKIAVDS